MTNAIEEYARRVWLALQPPPDLSVSEWADANRVLSSEHAAMPGRWHTATTEYLRGPMDALSSDDVQDVVVMGCSQHGKTEFILNACGYYAQHEPCPILIVQPTLPMAEAFSKDRLQLMFRDSPALHDLLEDPRANSKSNTILHKQYPGGHITIAGANSPASLASRPIRIVFCDEVDRYEASAGAEGDPVELAFKRAKSFWNKKRVMTSSPTRTNSRIFKAWSRSNQQYFLVPCPYCEARQRLYWNPQSDNPKIAHRVRWDANDASSARYYCLQCDRPWEDLQRHDAVKNGTWVATVPKVKKTMGFWIGGLYVPWTRIEEHVQSWIDARESHNVEEIRVFINTEVGDVFDDIGIKIDDVGLKARAESIVDTPAAVLFTTCGVDVQGDRLELELVGWGMREESWSIDYHVIVGDPATPLVWEALDKYLLDHKPAATCVDSGGHHTQQVYNFCADRFKRRVYAIKGRDGEGRVIWPRVPSRGKGGAKVWLIGVDTIKDQLFSYLKKQMPGPGYCHLARGRDDAWYAGLASEVAVEKIVRGRVKKTYVIRPGHRNEPLDCRVYAYAALASFGRIVWDKLAIRLQRAKARKEEAQVRVTDAPRDDNDAPTRTYPAPTGTHVDSLKGGENVASTASDGLAPTSTDATPLPQAPAPPAPTPPARARGPFSGMGWGKGGGGFASSGGSSWMKWK